jgi:hypothetical protein
MSQILTPKMTRSSADPAPDAWASNAIASFQDTTIDPDHDVGDDRAHG